MGMQSHYEINVSLNGRHLFATAERSCVTREQFNQVFFILLDKFPASLGYHVGATFWECKGQQIKA